MIEVINLVGWASWLIFMIIFAVSKILQMKRKRAINAEMLRHIEEGKDGTWQIAPGLTFTIAKMSKDPQPAKEENSND